MNYLKVAFPIFIKLKNNKELYLDITKDTSISFIIYFGQMNGMIGCLYYNKTLLLDDCKTAKDYNLDNGSILYEYDTLKIILKYDNIFRISNQGIHIYSHNNIGVSKIYTVYIPETISYDIMSKTLTFFPDNNEKDDNISNILIFSLESKSQFLPSIDYIIDKKTKETRLELINTRRGEYFKGYKDILKIVPLPSDILTIN